MTANIAQVLAGEGMIEFRVLKHDEFTKSYDEAIESGFVFGGDVTIVDHGNCSAPNHEWLHAAASCEEIEILPDSKLQSNKKYEVLNYELFRKLIVRYPDAKTEHTDGTGDKIVYKIIGEDFIEVACDLDIIAPYSGDDGKAIIITSPDLLLGFMQDVGVRKDGEDTRYYITIRGLRLAFDLKELTDVMAWREKIIQCNMVISFDIKSHALRDEWSRLIANTINRSNVEWEEEMSADDLIAAILVERIQQLIEVDDRTAFKRNPAAKLREDGAMLVKTETLRQILQEKNIALTFSALRRVLASYLARSSKQLTINKDRVSVWFFKVVDEEKL